MNEFDNLGDNLTSVKPKKIEWLQVLKDILNKPVNISMITEVAEKHRLREGKIHYSEVVRFVNSIPETFNVEKRKSSNGRRFYLITRKVS
jgi:hypothetical protein